MLSDRFHFAFRVLQLPVQVIQLDLHKFEHAFIPGQEFVDRLRQHRVAAEAQMTDPAQPLLLPKIFHQADFRIVIEFQRPFADVVKQVKVKIIHPAFFHLFMEHRVHR